MPSLPILFQYLTITPIMSCQEGVCVTLSQWLIISAESFKRLCAFLRALQAKFHLFPLYWQKKITEQQNYHDG